MPDKLQNKTDKNQNSNKKFIFDCKNTISQAGKTPEEMLPYLLSGEPDDLSNEFFDKV